MSETTNADELQFGNVTELKSDDVLLTYPLKLQIEYNCFREADIFGYSANAIKFLARFPEYEHDGHRTFMKALGSAQNYKLYTEGRYLIRGNTARLIYNEDAALGLSGETVSLNFSRSENKRSSLLYEQVLSGRRLFFANGQTVNVQNIGGVRTEICTVTKKLLNTMSENGGRLILDYETVCFSMSMFRARLEIKAERLQPEEAAEDSDTSENGGNADSRRPSMPLIYIAGKI